MKQFTFLVLLSVLSWTNAQEYKFLGNYTSDGTPLYFDGRDVVTQATLNLISDALPEGYPVPDYNPQYISSGYDTDILLDADADVWVTFVGEGAGYKNVLGFYTYDLNAPLSSRPNPEDITIVFPNVSAQGSGGGLQVGDKVKIGRFTAGTGIGWVLLANGWNGQVTAGNWQLFSNPDFNPEADPALRFHNVLLNDSENKRVILGFEDIRRDYGSCDNDFNDALFYISANPYEALRTSNYNEVTEHSKVSSGNDGGLESNGDLASLIARRNYERSYAGSAKNRKGLQTRYSKGSLLNSKISADLQNYFPQAGMYGNETPFVSTPSDLIQITNADKVLSVDYYQGDNRVSAALAIGTKDQVYNHSKVICDRLNRSVLKDVRRVQLQGHPIIYTKLLREGGELEYTLSFSILKEQNAYTVYSLWNMGEYPKGEYLNFQVWGSNMGQVASIVNHVLNSLADEKPLRSGNNTARVPEVFINSGHYRNGKLHLNITNRSGANTMELTGSYKKTEQSEESSFSMTYPLNGRMNQELIVQTGYLFDMGFSVLGNNAETADALYMADGPWGVDFDPGTDVKNSFVIEPQTYRPGVSRNYQVERGFELNGQIRGTINTFRHILGGDQFLNVSEYPYLEFTMSNNLPVEVILLTETTKNWGQRLRLTIEDSHGSEPYSLALSDFKDANGQSHDFKLVKTIVFSVQGDYVTPQSFNLKLQDLAFAKDNYKPKSWDTLPYEEARTNQRELYGTDTFALYPNPFYESATIHLEEASDFVTLILNTVEGQLVYNGSMETFGDDRTFRFNAANLPKGMYLYTVLDDSSQIVAQGKILKN